MTVIAIKRRAGMLNPDLTQLRSAAQGCAANWGAPSPTIRLYWLRKPRGSWRVIWSNDLPAGAAGVHLDAKGTPYALIGSSEGMEVVAHEVLEMLVDPLGERFVKGNSLRTGAAAEYLVEVCDPVEETPYAYVRPSFYTAPHIDAGGYISWIEGGSWWQGFADQMGRVTYRELGPAQARTRSEKDQLINEKEAT